MNVVRVKPGVLFTVIAPGGFAILSALEYSAAELGEDITITSACDGEHSGPDDPHHKGEAYDVRTHDLMTTEQKEDLLVAVENELATRKVHGFYAFIEDPGTDNEHIHVQVAKGTTYP